MGRSTAPGPPAVPLEAIALRPVGPSAVQDADAGVVPHSWGVEIRFDASGFTRGERLRATVSGADGSVVPAGEFNGTGSAELSCNLQSALLRADATGVRVRDESGRTVLAADLAPA